MTNLCVPVLNNYTGVLELIISAENGTVIPDHYFIFDNGGQVKDFLGNYLEDKITTIIAYENLGVARAWNWFLTEVPEERIISNDDLVLAEDTVEKMVNCPGGLVYVNTIDGLNRYSLFLIRDWVVDKVGLFDEAISPNYAYFEDNDFDRRLITIYGIKPEGIKSDVFHVGSTTMNKYSSTELSAHHKKFELARENYIKKWNGLPGHETFLTPYGK